MHFEWDRAKAQRNLRKHKVTFDEAVTVFHDPLSATFADPDHSAEELRFIIMGQSKRKCLLVVSYTERPDAIRIISARKATRHERRNYEETTQ